MADTPAVFQDDHFVTKPGYFLWKVGDIDDRNIELVANAKEVGDDALFQWVIEIGQGFIQQKQ